MALRIRRISPDATPSSQLSLETLARVLSPAIVAEVIDRCAAREKRARKLPASTVLLLCVAMNLYSNDCLAHVFFRLVSRMRWLLGDPDALRVSKGALCQARYRLGARPLVELFRRVCKPLATPSTPQAFLFGLRLMALDATVMDVADTPENVRAFGKRRAPRGESAWPQIRMVAISECSTHAVVEAGVWPHDFDERSAGMRLLRGVGDLGVLLLWDRGFHSFEMVKGALARGAHLLGRLPATVKPLQTRTLADGTKLVVLRRRRPPDEEELRTGEITSVTVRMIRYTLEDPNRPGHRIEHRLITSLLDPDLAPARQIVVAYHARWEFELAVDEIKTHQRQPQKPLRSERPVGVIQEAYGLLVAHHYVVRAVMTDAARTVELPPGRLSFTNTLRIIREMVPEAQRTASADHPRLYRQLLSDVSWTPLPPRADRSNPRVVKRKMSKFRVKNPSHRAWPQPTKPFREAVVLLI